MRPDILNSNMGELTQGSIISCIGSYRYHDCNVLGIVITARCDIAQDKFPVLNYLPMVSLIDWMKADGLDIVISAEKNNFNGKLKNIFKASKLSENILTGNSLESIGDAHFNLSDTTKSKKEKQNANNYHDLISEIGIFNQLVFENDAEQLYNWFLLERKNVFTSLVQRLSKHGVSGYYMFERLFEDSPNFAYVCLQREVSALPRELAKEIAEGIEVERYSSNYKHSHFPPLCFNSNELAMPLLVIGSPTIEHFMQTFSNLFARIGLDDPNQTHIQKIIEESLT